MALALALALAASARADLEAGLAAYEAEDWTTTMRELLPEAEAGNAEAQYLVGSMYRRGRSVQVNVELGMRWNERAARNGSNWAMYAYGSTYDDGRHVLQDSNRAECWYRLAAERGHSPAQHALSMLLHRRFEWSEAAHWRRRALAQGNAYALYRRATVELLNPTREDKTDAFKMLLLAADRGMLEAVAMVEVFRDGGLSGGHERQFEEARRLADVWKATPEAQVTEPMDGIPSECVGRQDKR